MKECELLCQLMQLVDAHDRTTVASLAAKLGDDTYLERLRALLAALSHEQPGLSPEVIAAREASNKAYTRSRAREDNEAYTRQEEHAQFDKFTSTPEEDDETFHRPFAQLKGRLNQNRTPQSQSQSQPLRDDERIVR